MSIAGSINGKMNAHAVLSELGHSRRQIRTLPVMVALSCALVGILAVGLRTTLECNGRGERQGASDTGAPALSREMRPAQFIRVVDFVPKIQFFSTRFQRDDIFFGDLSSKVVGICNGLTARVWEDNRPLWSFAFAFKHRGAFIDRERGKADGVMKNCCWKFPSVVDVVLNVRDSIRLQGLYDARLNENPCSLGNLKIRLGSIRGLLGRLQRKVQDDQADYPNRRSNTSDPI